MSSGNDIPQLESAANATKAPEAESKPYSIQLPGKLTEADLKGKTKHLSKEFDTWFQSKEFQRIKENYELVENIQTSGSQVDQTLLPVAGQVIETLQSRKMAAIMGAEKLTLARPFTTAPNPQGGNEDKILVEDLTNQQITDTPDFIDKADEAMKTQSIEGTIVAKCFWDFRECYSTNVLKEIDPTTMNEVEVGREDVLKRQGHPNFTPRSVKSLRWDPRVQDKISNSSWISDEDFSSFSELVRMAEQGIIDASKLDEIKKLGPTRKDQDKSTDTMTKEGLSGSLPPINWEDGRFKLTEWWMTLTYPEDVADELTGEVKEVWKRKEVTFWMVQDEILVRFEENGLKPQRKPYVSAKEERRTGRFLGTGPVDKIKGICKNIRTFMEKKRKLVTRASMAVNFYTPSSGFNPKITPLKEDTNVVVNDVNAIKREEVPVAAIAATKEALEFLINQAKESTASNEISQGVAPEGGPTATEISALEGAASKQFQYHNELNGYNFWAGIAKEYHQLTKQFAKAGELTIREGGNNSQAREVLPEQIQGEYDFIAVTPRESAQKIQRAQQLTGVAQQLWQAQVQSPQFFTDGKGQVKRFLPFEMLVNEILPLLGIKTGRTYFADGTPNPVAIDPLTGQPAANSMPSGGAPAPAVPPPAAPAPEAALPPPGA